MCPRDTQNYCSLFNQHTLDLTAISVFEITNKALFSKGIFDIHVERERAVGVGVQIDGKYLISN